jgi:hypothetical protein
MQHKKREIGEQEKILKGCIERDFIMILKALFIHWSIPRAIYPTSLAICSHISVPVIKQYRIPYALIKWEENQ